MSLTLYAHPFSSYCQKVLVALYENETPFAFRMLAFGDEQAAAELRALWPLQRMPVLVDGGRTWVESSVIIEHLDLEHPGRTRWLPEDPRAALAVRMLDRCFDHYVMTPMQRIVFDFIRPPEERDARGVAEARALLDTAYRWLEDELARRGRGGFGARSLVDCAAAPALLYADWVHPIDAGLARLRAYRQQLLAWPAFARAVDEARPYRAVFPPGDPGRD